MACRRVDVYTIFVGVRRVTVFALFFGIRRIGTFAQLNIRVGGVAIPTLPGPAANREASGECEVLNRGYDEKTQDCCGRGCHWWRHRRYCRFTDQTP
jgi:hypothetical protein